MRLVPFVMLVSLCLPAFCAAPSAKPLPEFPLKENDHILWYGSSSTRIGVWPRTMEFLLRTRHPELKLTFEREGVGGGTFAVALKEMDEILDGLKPTVVLFNFGGNDATKGDKGVAGFKASIKEALDKVRKRNARPMLMTPQPGDERLAGKRNDNLQPYAEAMLAFAKEQNVPGIDTHHPLELMFEAAVKDEPNYTINKDKIHLTDSAYVAWAYFIYEALTAPPAESSVELTRDGKLVKAQRCKISNVEAGRAGITFTREDEILPLLPPNPVPATSQQAPARSLMPPPSPALEYAQKHGSDLPPRKYCPLEKESRYFLKIAGLDSANYAISVDGKPLGSATAEQLAAGVNLNSLLLDSGNPAPWADLVLEIWRGKGLDKIGKTKFVFEVRKSQ